jgi:hypothetical protein
LPLVSLYINELNISSFWILQDQWAFGGEDTERGDKERGELVKEKGRAKKG